MNELHKTIRREMRKAGFNVTRRAKARDEEVAVAEGYLTEEMPNGTVSICFVPLYLTYAGKRQRPMTASENLEARETATDNLLIWLRVKGFICKKTEGQFVRVWA